MRILVVDSTHLVCDLVSQIIMREPDMEVIGCAHSTHSALDKAVNCEIMVARPTLPHNGLLVLLEQLERVHSRVKTLVIDLPQNTLCITRYLDAGAVGYAHEGESAEHFIRKIRALETGRPELDDEIVRAMNCPYTARRYKTSIDMGMLTKREVEIVLLLGEGLSNDEIGTLLFIETGTVKNHIHSILKKLNVGNRLQAGAYGRALHAKRMDSRASWLH